MTPRGQPLKGSQLLLLWVFCACLLLAPVVQGEEYTCKVEMNGTCITKVKWNIPERYAVERKPFTVSYESEEGKTEIAVVLHYIEDYGCEPANDHTCDKANNCSYVLGNFFAPCVTGRNYSLAADGDVAISCGTEQTPSATQIIKEISMAKTDATNLAIGIGVGLLLFLMAGAGGFLLSRQMRHCRKKEDHSELAETGKPMLPEKGKKKQSPEGDSKV